MSLAVPKRLLQYRHLCARTFSWTVVQCCFLAPASPKRLLQYRHLWSRRFS